MTGNYFAVSRSLIQSDLWLAEPFSRGQAWIDLIGLARWKAGHARVKGVRIELERGQLCWSEVKLAERWQWSRGKVRRFLDELETEQQIVQQKSSVTSVISLLNYDRYQNGGTAFSTAGGHQKDSERTSGSTRKKKVKKRNKEKKIPSYSDDFEKFWNTVPSRRKARKAAAYKNWKDAVKDTEPQVIISAATEYAASDKGQGQYALGPTRWLKDNCWNDDREAWKADRAAINVNPPAEQRQSLPSTGREVPA